MQPQTTTTQGGTLKRVAFKDVPEDVEEEDKAAREENRYHKKECD
jgi:hypothetical protein